jgi:hypothetical protein
VKSYIRTSIDAGPLEMAQANADVAEDKLKAVRLQRTTVTNADQDVRLALLEKTLVLNQQRASEVLAQVKRTGSAIIAAKREQEYADKLMLAQGKYIEQLLKERAQDEVKREIRQLEREAVHDGLSAVATGLRLAGNQQAADVMERFVQRGIALSNAFEKARLLDNFSIEHPDLMKGNELTADLLRGANIALFAFDVVNMIAAFDGRNSLLESIRQEFANLKDQMHARFDRVDASLATIYQATISGSAENQKTQAETLKRLDAILGNVASSEQRIMGSLARLERKLEESQLKPTLEMLTKCLNHKRERVTPLSAEEFANCMDALYAGAVRVRTVPDKLDAVERELIVSNFLRNGADSEIAGLAAIARTYGFDGIDYGQLRSLSDWQLCVDGYLLMAAAYPDLYYQEFRTGSNRFRNQPTQVDKMIEAGAQSIKAVSGLGGKTGGGMGRLFDDYVNALKTLKDDSLKRRKDLENLNLPQSTLNLGGFDTAKPINQAFPNDKPHKSYAPYKVTWCPSTKDKRTINDTYYLGSDVQFTITGLQQFIPTAYLLAENLGVGTVKPGIFQMHHYTLEKRPIVSLLIVGEYYPAGKSEPSGHVFRRVVELPQVNIPFHDSYRNLQKSQVDIKAVNENYRKAIQKHLDDHFVAQDSRDAFDPTTSASRKDGERRQREIAAGDDAIRKQTAEMYDVINHRYVAAAEYFAAYIKGMDIMKAALDKPVLTHEAIFADLNPVLQALRAEVTEAVASDITGGQLKSAGDDLTRAQKTADALLRLGWNDRVRMNGVFYSLFVGEYRLPTQHDLAGAYKRTAHDSELGSPDGVLLDPVANRKHNLRANMSKEEYDKLVATLKQEIESLKSAAEDKKADIKKQISLHSKQLEDVHLTRWVRVILPYAEPAFLEAGFATRVGWTSPKLIELMIQMREANEVTSEQLLVLKLAALYQLAFHDLSSSTGGEYARADRAFKEMQKFKTATEIHSTRSFSNCICPSSGPSQVQSSTASNKL